MSEGSVQEGGVTEAVAQSLLEGLEGVVEEDVVGEVAEEEGVLHLECVIHQPIWLGQKIQPAN